MGEQRDIDEGETMNEELEAWLAGRPQIIKDLAASHPPDAHYRLADVDDGSLYMIYSYSEDGTITVTRFSDGVPLWNVFGMKPENLIKVEEEKEGNS